MTTNTHYCAPALRALMQRMDPNGSYEDRRIVSYSGRTAYLTREDIFAYIDSLDAEEKTDTEDWLNGQIAIDCTPAIHVDPDAARAYVQRIGGRP